MRVFLLGILAAACLFIPSSTSQAVIIDSGDGASNLDPPPGFAHWHHVDERLGGTSVIYLGHGWVLTARHVGAGIVLFGGQRFDPDPDTMSWFGDPEHPADLMLFRLATNRPWPDLPLLEIARESPEIGERVLMVGNGRNRGKRLRTKLPGGLILTGWKWGPKTNKRWGTNRVVHSVRVVEHGDTSTKAFSTRFDSLYDGGATEHEAQAAEGDSGGAIFKRRDSADAGSEWVLAGVMFTVNHPFGGAPDVAFYGDLTHAVDLTAYRDDLIERIRPTCSDERDNDGDGLIDPPDDPDCASRSNENEGGRPPRARPPEALAWWIAGLAVALGLAAIVFTRVSRTPR